MAVKTILQSSMTGGDAQNDRSLHMMAKPVDELTDEICDYIQNIRDTLWAYPFCVGLSAPQLGINYAISVVNPARESPDNDIILINPKIIRISGKKVRKRESCMSLWGMTGEVERRDKIEIEFIDREFNLSHAIFTGFTSRVIQHEIDHLNGVLYSERMDENCSLFHASLFDGYTIIQG